jgi:hypothetical protein
VLIVKESICHKTKQSKKKICLNPIILFIKTRYRLK